jgi:hypothetical protein
MAKPIARFVFRERDSGKYFECGLMWPSKKEGFNPNFAPHKEDSASPDGTSEKIAFSKALARVEAGDGFINISTGREDGLIGLVGADAGDNDDF